MQPDLAGETFPQAKAAIEELRRLAHGTSQAPPPRQAVAAAIGVAAAGNDRELAIALELAWVGFLRLPSDLSSMGGSTLIPPVAAGGLPKWSLLLYPQEQVRRSKTLGHDEGVVLHSSALNSADMFLRDLKNNAGPQGAVWSFDTRAFNCKFRSLMSTIGISPGVIAYQIRHGAASHAAASGAMRLDEISERLRHGSLSSTLRYAKHVRYATEVERLPSRVRAYGDWVDEHLGPILRGTLVPPGSDTFATTPANRTLRR